MPQPHALRAHPSRNLKGRVRVPGDKSISHRSLMFGALATGTTRITGLLEGEDVINTARIVSQLGAKATKTGDTWEVLGRGVGGLQQPDTDLDFGNSGTGARLMFGVIAGNDLSARFVGDASLSRRPMARVLDPLKKMGLRVDDDRTMLPLTVHGNPDVIPMEYELPVPSAQVKSAVLIAGLHARGRTTVIEKEATRDHTERMLRYLGADISVEDRGDTRAIHVAGDAELSGRDIAVPGDPSSAAFIAAAAAIVPGSDVTIENVLINPTRTGFYTTLSEMGADIAFINERDAGGEAVADIRIASSKLKGVVVPAERAPSMIDEYPVLAVVAAFADGDTVMNGLAELKVKESDRLAATSDGLAANGISATVQGDTLTVHGMATPPGGGRVATHLDHRIAMAFSILGLASDRPVEVDDGAIIATSFPEFEPLMAEIGASLERTESKPE
ncbi:MAG: 3-phosphoshikimate 1-carboxyvinyltransferase [Pseudomonadota bacterium]